MVIYPAIDIMGGEAVRLTRGLAESRQVVGKPLELIERFKAAPLIHVVDLDGALRGSLAQLPLLTEMAGRHSIQVGGGIRTGDDVERLMNAGVARVVIGTAAIQTPTFLDALLQRWGAEKIVVAVDVKEGRVALSGWQKTSDLEATAFAGQLAARGARFILCTAVHRDGTLEGPDLDVLNGVQGADGRLKVIASGGIGSLEDIRACSHLAGVIVGKALYHGRFTLAEAMAC